MYRKEISLRAYIKYITDNVSDNNIINKFADILDLAKNTELIITGGSPLIGNCPIKVPGSKWGVAEIITAALIADREIILHNVPPTLDTFCWIEILKDIGVKVEYSEKEQILLLDSSSLNNTSPNKQLIQNMRASFHILAPIIAQKGKAKIAYPGGDKIGHRSISQHLEILEQLGINYKLSSEGIEAELRNNLPNNLKIQLKKPQISVTIMAIIFAAKLNISLEISNIPRETEIKDTVEFLKILGADIEIYFDKTTEKDSLIKISRGINNNRTPLSFEIPADRTWALSFALLGPITNGSSTVYGIRKEDYGNTFDYLSQLGIDVNIYEQDGKTYLNLSNNSNSLLPINEKIEAGYLPQMNSDMLPFFSLTASLKKGFLCRFGDTLLKDRDSYLGELQKMGANIEILNGSHDFIIHGVPNFISSKLEGKDLRATMVLIMAALAAKGTSTIKGIEHVLRGYPKVVDYLKTYFQANIKEVRVININGVNIKWDIDHNCIYDFDIDLKTVKDKDSFLETLREILLFSDNKQYIEKSLIILNNKNLDFSLSDSEKLDFLDSILKDSPASPFINADRHFIYPKYYHDFAYTLKAYTAEQNLNRSLKIAIFGPGDGKKVYYNRMCALALNLTIEYFAFDINQEFLSKTHDLNPEVILDVLDLRRKDILNIIEDKGLKGRFDYLDFTSVIHEVFSFSGIKWHQPDNDDEYFHYEHDFQQGIESVQSTLKMSYALLTNQGILKILDGLKPNQDIIDMPVFIKYHPEQYQEFGKLIELISAYPYAQGLMVYGGQLGPNNWFGISVGILNFYLEKLQFMAQDFRGGITNMEKEIQELYHYFTAKEYLNYLQEAGFSSVLEDIHQQVTHFSLYKNYFKLCLDNPSGSFSSIIKDAVPPEEIPTIMDQRMEITARKSGKQNIQIVHSKPRIPLAVKKYTSPFSDNNELNSRIFYLTGGKYSSWIDVTLDNIANNNNITDFLIFKLMTYENQINNNEIDNDFLQNTSLFNYIEFKIALFRKIVQSNNSLTKERLTYLEIWNTFIPIALKLFSIRNKKISEGNNQCPRLLIGISGSPASGKTSFTEDLITITNLIYTELNTINGSKDNQISAHYGTDNDFYTDWRLSLRNIPKTHPDSYDINRSRKNILKLRNGTNVVQNKYDHIKRKSGGKQISVSPASFIFVEGLNVLTESSIRELLDYSIFIEAPSTALSSWANKREQEREALREKVLKSYQPRDFNSVWGKILWPIFKEYHEPNKYQASLRIMHDENHMRTIFNSGKADFERLLLNSYNGLVLDIDRTITSENGVFDLEIIDFLLDLLQNNIPVGIFSARNIKSIVLLENSFLKIFIKRLHEKKYSTKIIHNLYLSSSEGGTFIEVGKFLNKKDLDYNKIIKENQEREIDKSKTDSLLKILSNYLGLKPQQIFQENYRILLKELCNSPLETAFILNSIFELFDDLPFRASPSENSVLIITADQNKSLALNKFIETTNLNSKDIVSIGDQGKGSDYYLLNTGLSITVDNKQPNSKQISIPELYGFYYNQGTNFALKKISFRN